VFYEWIILQLDAYPQFDGKTDVVFVVHWRRNASNGNGLTAQIYGAQQIKISPDDQFTPYNQLTKPQVVGWVKEALGEETILRQEEYLRQQIKDQINPPVVVLPPPWGENLTPSPVDPPPVDPDLIGLEIVDPDPVDPDPVDPDPVDLDPVDLDPVDLAPVYPYPFGPYTPDPIPFDPIPFDPDPFDGNFPLSE